MLPSNLQQIVISFPEEIIYHNIESQKDIHINSCDVALEERLTSNSLYLPIKLKPSIILKITET